MKKLILLVILAFSISLSPLATYAATPKVINYQGKLDGVTPNDPKLVVFEIFADAAGGSALWIEQKSVTVDDNGFFSVYLGDVNPIDLKFDKQYYVQITVGNNQPFPRTKLTSTPSAFHAIDADSAQFAFTAGIANDVVPKAIGLDNLADEVLTAGGDLTGMYPNPKIKPSAIIDNIPDGGITSRMLSPNISTSPSGPAGGDLFGTYPDPLIAVGAVKTDRIFDGAVTNVKIADGAVTNNKIVSLDAAKLTNVPALNYQVAVNTDPTIDGDGTLADPLGLADDAVSTSKIVDGAVTNAKVGADAITSDKILDETILASDIATGAVTTSEILNETILAEDIATGAVTTNEILNETILAEDIATGAVTTNEILNETILADDIATGAVTTSEILNSTILTEDLSDNAVTQAKLADDAVRVRNIDVSGAAPTNGDVLYFDGGIGEMRWGQEKVETSAPLTGDGTTINPVTLDPTFGSVDDLLIRTAGGWVSGKINTNNLADGAVTTAKLADNSVTSVKIKDGEVMNADLADASVTTAKIKDGEVMTADLADGAVTTPKIADGSITTAKILDGDIQTADLANKAVTNAKIDEDAVTGNKVLNGSLSSLDLDATGVAPGIYGDPSATPSVIDVPEYKVDAQGRILTSKENSYTVISASTIFNESPVSDITVDGTYDNLDLQIKPGVVGTTELADNSVTSVKIKDGEVMTADLADNSVTSAKIIDGSVTSADIADGTVANIDLAPNSVATGNIIDGTIANADMGPNSVGTSNIIDNNVLNTKIGSGVQVAGKVLKADGAGNTVWGDDLGLILPYTGSYDGPGDAFTITHTGAVGNGSAAVFTSSTSTNTSPAVSITKGVDAGAGSALVVSGTGVKGTNYIAKVTNTNLAEGRTLLLENNAPVLAAQITDPDAIPANGDEFVTPDPTGTDLNDATLVVRNKNASPSNEKLAIKTYGSIQANSTIQGTNIVAYGGQVTLYNNVTGAVAAIHPPTNPGDPLNVTPGLDINSTSAVPTTGLNNIWDSVDGVLIPAGTGTDADVPTALAVSNSIGVVSGEPFITFQADGGSLTNNRVFNVNSTLTKTINAGDNSTLDLSINLTNPNTWTGTQTLSAAGNGLVVTTNSDLQGTIANSTGDVTVGDNLHVTGTSALDLKTTVGSNALGGIALEASNNDGAVPTVVITNNNAAGPSINATGNVTVNSGGLNVTGATDLNTGLNVDGASTLDAVTIAGTLSQSGGQVTLAGNVDATAGLDVTGASTFAGTLSQTTAGDQVKFAGNVDANNGLDVIGAATVAGTLTQTTGAQVTFSGNIDANSGLDLVGTFGFDGESITNIDNIAEGLVSGDNGLPTSGNVATAIAAVADAQFLTLAFDPDLTNERKATFSANFATVDNGANANYDIDLSNTGVTAGAYGNNTGTSYATYTVDGKGRLSLAATQAIVVNDNGTADIDITGASSDNLDLQIRTNAVGPNELATADYSADLAAGNYNLGNLDGTIIGGGTPAAGTFTNLTANTDLTIPAHSTVANTTVDDIYTSADFGGGPLILGNDTDLITAGAVAAALAATDLQIAYNNGNTIVTAGGNDVVIGGTENLDVQTPIINTVADVTVNDNLSVTGTTSSTGTITSTTGDVVSTTGNVTANGNVTATTGSVTAGTTVTGGTGVIATTGNVSASAGDVVANNNVTATTGNVTATAGDVTANNNVTATTGNVTATAGNVAAGNNVTAGGNVIATGDVSGVNGTFTGTVTGVAGTFSGLISANGGLTMGAAQNFTMGGNAVNDIYVSADGTNPITGATDAQLITAKTVMDALTAHTLQQAYVNGNVITTSALEGNVQIAGTELLDIDVNTTLNGSLTQVGNTGITGNLSVTGTTTLTGAVNQSAGNVAFGGPVAANNTLAVTGGANVAGGVNISAGGLTVQAGGITVNAGAVNLGPGGTTLAGGLTVSGGGIMLTGNLETPGASPVNIADNLVVTGTSDLQGAISNSTGDVAITDGLLVTLSGAQTATVNGSGATTALNVAGSGNKAINTSNNSANPTVSATNTGAGSAVNLSSTGSTAANATIVAENIDGTSAGFAISVPEDGGHLQLSATTSTTNIVTNDPIAVNGSTVIRLTTTGAAGNISLGAGTEVGQILIVTNENAGDITITSGTLGVVTIVAQTAAQFVWNGTTWVKLS